MLCILSIQTADAANVTYYAKRSNSVSIATGITTDSGSCGTDPSAAYIEELSTNIADMCVTANAYRIALGSPPITYSEHYYNTAYGADTTVTGVSYQVTIRDGGTFGFQLFSVDSSGSKTYLSSEVTQANGAGATNNYTVDLSSQSGTVPSGEKLGLRTRLISLNTDPDARIYIGNLDNRTSNISGKLIVDETAASDSTAPDAVSDLATGTTTSSSIALSWTAPGDDGSTGTATTYDIRYSTSTINDGNWASATQATGEPSPSVASTSESFTVTGLSSSTTYYFAIKTDDEVPNTSAISNIPSAATAAPDVTAPAAVSDLATSNATGTTIDLDWTAPGDDGSTGTATTYDIRYSTSTINDGNWASATQVTGEPTPSVATTSESMTVTGLTSGTTYYFAIKTIDEEPNTSSLSNVPNASTLADGGAPATITLSASSPTENSIQLTWTAPGDDGSSGTATSYDIRYSTSAINDGNWGSATTVSGEPTPQIASSPEYFTVTGLSASTTYYFAIKTSDEVPNTSTISNSPNATTSAASSGEVLYPSGRNTGVGDSATYTDTDGSSSLDSNDGNTSYGTSSGTGNDYYLDIDDSSASGTIDSVQVSVRLRCASTCDGGWLNDDPAAFDIGLRTNNNNYVDGGHTHSTTSYSLYNGSSYATNPFTTSAWTWGQIDALVAIVDHTANGTTATIRATELYVTVNYTPGDSTAPASSTLATDTITTSSIKLDWTAPGDDGSTGTASVYDIRYSTSTINDGNWASATQVTGEPSPSVASTSETFTITGLSDDTTYYFAMKTRDEVPNISTLSNVVNGTTLDGTAPGNVSDLATGTVTSQAVDLSWTAPGDSGATGTATTYDIRYSTSTINSGNWASATQTTGEPSPSVAGTSESFTVTGLSASTTYYFAVKTSDEVPNESGVSNSPSGATVADTFAPDDVSDLATSNATNTTIDLDWTAPGDDAAAGTATTYDIRYSTSAINAGNWDAATQVDDEPTPSVASTSESMTVTGLSAGTTYYFSIKTGDEIINWSGVSNSPSLATTGGDETAPAAVSDLSGGSATTSSIQLSWTAPGDDGSTGTATTYDIRYSTSIITEGNWSSATTITGEPSPSVAGSSESKTVSGLSSGTTYYFAIKTSDEVPNTSVLSNVAVATTDSPAGSLTTYYLDSADGGDHTCGNTYAPTYTGTDGLVVTTAPSSCSSRTRIRQGSGSSSWVTFAVQSTAVLSATDSKQVTGSTTAADNIIAMRTMDGGSGDITKIELCYGTSTSSITACFDSHQSGLSTGGSDGTATYAFAGTPQVIPPNNRIIWRLSFYDVTQTRYHTYAGGSYPSRFKVTIEDVDDTTAPDNITDLATGTVTNTSIALDWTAPGDDGGTGTASLYDIRYRTDAAITAGNWATATQVSGEPAPSVATTSESFTVTGLDPSTTYYFAIKTGDEVPNWAAVSNSPNATTLDAPVGGYTADNVIPTAQLTQATDGSGDITINWKGRDDEADNVTLNTFQYSVDGGTTWQAPGNDDASASLSSDWDDNGGSNWSTATTLGAATAHSFTFNTKHGTVSGLNGVDQADVQVRFKLNDGSSDSGWLTSQSFQVDNVIPTATITSGFYDYSTDTLTITGTNFTTMAAASTDIKSYVDWTKFVWDINGDNATTANITFVEADVTSLTVTNATTLTLVFAGAKGTAIEATAGYGSAGGVDTLDVTAGFSKDVVGNVATTDAVADGTLTVNTAPIGGYTADNVIPAAQVTQSTDGNGIMTINWKAVDEHSDNITLNTFQYSDDGGSTWYTPTNADASAALSANWSDDGSSWSSAATFGAATAHSFTFNTKHADVTGVQSLDSVDQSDVQIRFTLNDGTVDSASPATSESFQVDNVTPTATITSASYNAGSDTLTITGTNFTTIAAASTDIKSYVDWTKFVWDINGDDATTANITFVVGDVTSLTVTDATTLTLVFAGAKGTAIEGTADYSEIGGSDTLDVTAGFSVDAFGNVSTTDAVADGTLSTIDAPVGGYTADDVIPVAQITQSTGGDGVITINWKARDNQSDNVTLNTFQYSDDGGSTWYTQTNGDTSAALSANWDDNGSSWSTATTFGAAAAHSFTFNTKHADVTGVQSLDSVDQSDVQVRFTLNDGTEDGASPATSESFQVDNVAPTATITSASYNAGSDTLTITGTNFTTIAAASTDVKSYVDWTKFVWDINGDDATTANITFVVGDVTSLTVTNATTLTLVFTGAKGTAIEGTAGYSVSGGADTLDVTAGFSKDVVGNAATTDAVADGTLTTDDPPVGGYTAVNVIPAAQISQSTSGDGVITINWKGRDNQADNVTLNTFQYSDDGGSTWYTQTNGDTSAALSANWDDNGSSWSTATTFGAATAHSFTFNTKHADVTGVQSLDSVDQSDVQIRFTLNDGSDDSASPATSESFQVDNAKPTATFTSASYAASSDTLTITGTNYTTIAAASTDIKSYVDWTKFVWDINGDNATTANITFVVGDVTSLTVTNATTLTLVFTGAKGTAIEGTAGYSELGGSDTLDVTAGFSKDAFGNAATTDAVADGTLATIDAPVGGYTADDVIPAAQISQATDGSGVITINWKGRDNQSDNVSLNTFEYSVDGGSTWNAPTNADASASLSTNWDDNGGSNWSTATTLAAATAHSFTFNTKHADVSGLDNVDQSDVQVRFTLNDATEDSSAPVTSESFQVDNEKPTATITSGAYNSASDTLTITGTNFTTIAAASTDIKSYVDWSKFVWDINGDNATTANITFVVGDVTSLTVTNATTLTLVFTGAKGTAIEGTSGYGSAGGADTLDVTAGFSIDALGNTATTDAVADGSLSSSEPDISVTKSSSVISDPISASNPKRIPGAIVEYTVSVSNSGDASPDANSTFVTSSIDTGETEFYVTDGVTFTDGTTSSNLAKGTVTYSQTASPGPYVYDYTPSPDGDGYDANITSTKITTTGTFAFGGAPSASFSLKYRVRVK